MILQNLRLVTMAGDEPLAVIDNAVLAADDGIVSFAGPAAGYGGDLSSARDMAQALVLPGLVVCHNAVLWAGDVVGPTGQTAEDYRDRTLAVAKDTCAADDHALLALLQQRIERLARSGVTACELKSGFGTEPAEELRLAVLLRRFQADCAMRTKVTLAIGHAYAEAADPEALLAQIETEIVPQTYALACADAVEVFCDDGAGLDLDHCSTILELYYKKKTPSRVACDRFDDCAGATLPASFYSRAALFLNRTDDIGLAGIARVGCVPVLVPEAVAADDDGNFPDLELLRDAGGRFAISTEAGPDGCGTLDLLATLRSARNQLSLSVEEAIQSVTVHAAQALGLADQAGCIAPGRPCDLALFDADSPETLLSNPSTHCTGVVRSGVLTEFN